MKKAHRILIVEDNAADAELAIARLRKSGLNFDYKKCQKESQFKQLLKSFDPDIVLSDYNLPQFDGLAALRITREASPDLPFIFLSGAIGDEVAAESLKLGATDYILKDRAERLNSAVERSLRDAERTKVERLLKDRAGELERENSEMREREEKIISLKEDLEELRARLKEMVP